MIQLGFVVDFIFASVIQENSEGEEWEKREREKEREGEKVIQKIIILHKNIKTSLYNFKIACFVEGDKLFF